MKREIIVREVVDGPPRTEQKVVEIARSNRLSHLADVGMSLEEGKDILARIQSVIAAAQADRESVARRSRTDCGASRRLKDYRTRRIDTVFGRVSLRIARTSERCNHAIADPGLPIGRSTPEFDDLRAKLAADLSYGRVRTLLRLTLPVSTGVAPATVRAHTFRAAHRIGCAPVASASPPVPSQELRLGLDTAYVRSCHEDAGRKFPVLVGEAVRVDGAARMFGCVAYRPGVQAGLVRETLNSLGHGPHTVVTVFTDGEVGLRTIARRSLRGPIRPVLDWFHVALRLQHLRQFSQGLTTQLPSHAAAKRRIRREVNLLRWRLWNGKAGAVDDCINRLKDVIGAYRKYPPIAGLEWCSEVSGPDSSR